MISPSTRLSEGPGTWGPGVTERCRPIGIIAQPNISMNQINQACGRVRCFISRSRPPSQPSWLRTKLRLLASPVDTYIVPCLSDKVRDQIGHSSTEAKAPSMLNRFEMMPGRKEMRIVIAELSTANSAITRRTSSALVCISRSLCLRS